MPSSALTNARDPGLTPGAVAAEADERPARVGQDGAADPLVGQRAGAPAHEPGPRRSRPRCGPPRGSGRWGRRSGRSPRPGCRGPASYTRRHVLPCPVRRCGSRPRRRPPTRRRSGCRGAPSWCRGPAPRNASPSWSARCSPAAGRVRSPVRPHRAGPALVVTHARSAASADCPRLTVAGAETLPASSYATTE